jgi:hypothetical protein
LIERKLIQSRVLDGKPFEMATQIIGYHMKVGERMAYKILAYLLSEGYFTTRPRMLAQLTPKNKPPSWTQT